MVRLQRRCGLVSNYFNHLLTSLITACLFVCLDDEHSDREPEHHRFGCVFLHVADGCRRSGRNSPVGGLHLRSAGLSRVADENAALGFSRHVQLQHLADRTGSLRCRRLSHLVQQQRKNRAIHAYGDLSLFTLLNSQITKCHIFQRIFQ